MKNILQNSAKQGALLNEILLLSLNYFFLCVKILDSVAKTIFLLLQNVKCKTYEEQFIHFDKVQTSWNCMKLY